MGKFHLKRPRIISKKFPEVTSHVDNVTKSLEGLVFEYSKQVDKTLQKKRLMMTLSTLVLLLVLGNFISPKGKADSVIFHPDTCLGGWVNPRNAEGEPQTASNGDVTLFTSSNSAVLPKNTQAEIYCGNFSGTFDDTTTPVKILVSFAMTKGDELVLEEMIHGETFASSSQAILDTASTTEVSFTLLQASSSLDGASLTATSSTSSEESSSTVLGAPATASTEVVTSSTSEIATSSSHDGSQTFFGTLFDSVKDVVADLFENTSTLPTETDTVIAPIPQKEESQVGETSSPETQTPSVDQSSPKETETQPEPTSLLESLLFNISSFVAPTVFAEEGDSIVDTTHSTESTATMSTTTESNEQSLPNSIDNEQSSQTSLSQDTAASESSTASSTNENLTSIVSTSTATSTDVAPSTSTIAATSLEQTASTPQEVVTEANDTQNNFLEIIYTFDGVLWTSLGELNEISMKYRTFEIPVTASTTWKDMSQLQIKIVSKKSIDETPTVYLDAVKVEVLYEGALVYTHPDFTRDTILNDEVLNGVRVVTIINNETNKEEIWYMYLEQEATSTVTTSLVEASSSLLHTASSTDALILLPTSTTSQATSSEMGTTTPLQVSTSTVIQKNNSTTTPIQPVMPKNKWLKYNGVVEKTIATQSLIEEITKKDKEALDIQEKEERVPDFALDIIKKIKGTFLNAIIVQVEKESREELWLYDVEKGTQQKIDTGSSTSFAGDYPIGVKAGHVFWLSNDRSIVYAYNLTTNSILEQALQPFDVSHGERGHVSFEGVPFEVIISSGGFVFYSRETGEVFSDDDVLVAEALRKKLELDKVLDEDAISNLNLPVEEKKETTEGSSEESSVSIVE
ncbi:MAG: hypothetical protein RLZZ308_291 [Candidatus Parcubacteria bacterium]|jgi:hypothetical protein